MNMVSSELPPATKAVAEYSSLDLLIVLARKKRFILRFTLVTTVLAAMISFFLPNQYTAETIILPPSQNSNMGASLISQLAGGGSIASLAGIKNSGDMYVSLLRSRTVEDAVVQRFSLMARYKQKHLSDARKDFEKLAAVSMSPKDGMIRISVHDPDPELASEIANGYVDEFRKFSATIAITEASQRRLFFQQQLEDAKNNLANAEETLKHTEQSTGVLQIDSQAKSLIEAATTLRAQVVAKQVQIQGMRSFATEDNPELVIARQQLNALQGQLNKLAGTDQDDNSFIVPKGKIPEAGLEYVRKFRDVKYYETIYELIAKQFEMAKLDEARQGAIIQVADKAVPPDKKSSPKRTFIVLLAFLLAGCGSCVGCIFSDQLERMKHDPVERERFEMLRTALR